MFRKKYLIDEQVIDFQYIEDEYSTLQIVDVHVLVNGRLHVSELSQLHSFYKPGKKFSLKLDTDNKTLTVKHMVPFKKFGLIRNVDIIIRVTRDGRANSIVTNCDFKKI